MKRLRKDGVKRDSLTWVLPLIIFLVILLLPGAVGAANYIAQGRVYSAYALEEGEDVPNNPLTGIPDEQVIGDNMFAVEARNLVKVSVIAASDGSELGSYIARYDGGYFIHFTGAPGGIEVRFVVEELATSQVLLDTDELTFPDGAINIRYLLVLEGLSDIAGDREYAPDPPLPALYTGIFTRVGKIEVDYIDYPEGWANVDGTVSEELAIPQYEDAPFGGNLFIFGAFSRELYDRSGVFYRIKYVNYNDTSDYGYIDDSLVKTRYTVDFTTGEVNTERVTLGPLPPAEAGGYENCYKLTPIAESSNVFWSFPDLVALWRTGEFNGTYTISIEIIDLSSVDPDDPPEFKDVDYTDLTLLLDNVSPVARILPLRDGDPDTPRVYTPGSIPGGDDLLPNLLEEANFDTYYGGIEDPTCSILDLEGDVGSKYLAFKLKAYHTNGFLRYWHFRYERNDKKNEILIGKQYNGSSEIMDVVFPGARVTSTQTDVHGFEEKYLYLDIDHLQQVGESLVSCAYRFVIKAATRTTDGYHYLRWSWDQDLHYIQK